MARALRQRPGRRPAGLHGEPAVRPAPVARRHRRLARPRRRSAARRPAQRRARSTRSSPPSTRVEHELATDTFEFVQSDEDIHTAVERRVTELAGAAGAKIHTARSRNDQVATDLRLWCKRELLAVARLVVALQDVLLARAESAGDTYLPGYTHVQRAQPVLLAHHLLAHGWAFARDVDRLVATVERLDVSPLGAGALAGTSLPIDPAATAAALGFADVFANSLDAVSDRDFVAEALFDLALVGIHLARLGEEWVLWTSEEFGFARLDDAYATGSSMMPQKKNADIAELARGKSGRLIGNLTGLLATLKGLPLAYNRDLQEDKEPLFDSVDQVSLALVAIGGMIDTATFVPERMQAAADSETTSATDLAEWLVVRGTPFREAHAIVGELVRTHLASGRALQRRRGGRRSPRPGRGRRARARASACSAARRPVAAGPGPVAAQFERFAASLRRQREMLGRMTPAAPAAAFVLRPRRARRRAGAAQQGARRRTVRRAHRRGRGVPLRRAGRPLLPRADTAHGGDVRPGRPPVRVLHVRDAPLRQRRHRARRRRSGRAAARRAAARRPRRDGRAAPRPPAAGGRSRQAVPGVRHRPAPHGPRPLRGAATSASSTTAPRRPTSSSRRHASGSRRPSTSRGASSSPSRERAQRRRRRGARSVDVGAGRRRRRR